MDKQDNLLLPWAIRTVDGLGGIGTTTAIVPLNAPNEIIVDNETYYPKAVEPKFQRAIVHRVNTYDELVDMLEDFVTECDEGMNLENLEQLAEQANELLKTCLDFKLKEEKL